MRRSLKFIKNGVVFLPNVCELRWRVQSLYSHSPTSLPDNATSRFEYQQNLEFRVRRCCAGQLKLHCAFTLCEYPRHTRIPTPSADIPDPLLPPSINSLPA